MGGTFKRKKKENNKQELETTPTPASNSEVTAPTFRTNFYAPVVFKANITQMEKDKQTLPLYSLVGEDGLAPYVWISLAGDSARDRQVNFTPSRRGLKAVTLKNEYNKYPNVELEMYVPEYRESSIGTREQLGENSRALKEFRVGNTFSINWGYTRAHTRWGLFTIYERKIEFAQGTALLIVRGKMGAKLTATTSAEVFSSTTEIPVAQKVAQAAGKDQSANFDEMTPAEFANLVRRKQVVTGGNTIGQSLHKLASNAGLELVVDPTNDTLMFSTPFKLDLVKKGTPITRMTYGFPTSMIAEIDVETKRPKRSGTGKRKPTPVNISMGYEPKTRTGTSLIYGTLVLPVPDKPEEFTLLHFGFKDAGGTDKGLPDASRMRGFSLFGRKGDTPQKALEEAEERFPKKDKYRVRLNEKLNKTIPAGSEDGYYVLVYKTIEIKTNTVEELNSKQLFEDNGDTSTFKSQQQIDELSAEAKRDSSFYFEVLNSPPPITEGGVLKYPVRTLRAIKGKATPKPKPEVTPSTTTSIEATGYPEAPEGLENVETVSAPTDLIVQYDTLTGENRGFFLSTLSRSSPSKKQELLRYINQRNKVTTQKSKYKSSTSEVSERTVLRYSTVRKPEEPRGVPVSLGDSGVATASQDGQVRPETRPASISTGTPRPSRSLSGLKLTLRLKAGDWTMRVGKIVELTNVYKTVDGFYYIHSEEHQIDDNGFHTTLTCKRATHRQVSDAKQGKVTSLKKGTRKNGNSIQEVTDSKRDLTHLPDPEAQKVIDKTEQEKQNAKETRERNRLYDELYWDK